MEGEEDRSGSSKAKKDAEAEKAAQHEDGEPVISSPSKPSTHALRPSTGFLLCEVLILFGNDRTMHPNHLKSTSNPWFI